MNPVTVIVKSTDAPSLTDTAVAGAVISAVIPLPKSTNAPPYALIVPIHELNPLPLGYLCYSSKNISLKYAFETTFILSIIYILYLTCRKTDIVSVYTDDRFRVRNRDDIKVVLNNN